MRKLGIVPSRDRRRYRRNAILAVLGIGAGGLFLLFLVLPMIQHPADIRWSREPFIDTGSKSRNHYAFPSMPTEQDAYRAVQNFLLNDLAHSKWADDITDIQWQNYQASPCSNGKAYLFHRQFRLKNSKEAEKTLYYEVCVAPGDGSWRLLSMEYSELP